MLLASPGSAADGEECGLRRLKDRTMVVGWRVGRDDISRRPVTEPPFGDAPAAKTSDCDERLATRDWRLATGDSRLAIGD
jgi:hypothetical protein